MKIHDKQILNTRNKRLVVRVQYNFNNKYNQVIKTSIDNPHCARVYVCVCHTGRRKNTVII